jgi:hypothetical protein
MEAERTLVLDAETLDKVGLEVDIRLTDVWSMLFEWGTEALDVEFAGWLLRMAYVTGYYDSLREPAEQRGELCHALGYPVPEAAA